MYLFIIFAKKVHIEPQPGSVVRELRTWRPLRRLRSALGRVGPDSMIQDQQQGKSIENTSDDNTRREVTSSTYVNDNGQKLDHTMVSKLPEDKGSWC